MIVKKKCQQRGLENSWDLSLVGIKLFPKHMSRNVCDRKEEVNVLYFGGDTETNCSFELTICR